MTNLQTLNSVGIVDDVDGNGLKQFREKHNLTQEKLAQILKVSTNTVARWERNERRIPEFLNLALKTIERELPKSNN
jgi:DNA-binding transcriptional regulator YiaG